MEPPKKCKEDNLIKLAKNQHVILDNSYTLLELFLNKADYLVIIIDPHKKVTFSNLKVNQDIGKEEEILRFLEKNFLNTLSAIESLETTLSANGQRKRTIEWKAIPFNAHDQSYSLLLGKDITDFEELKNKFFTLDYIIKKVPGFVFWKNKDLKNAGCNENFARQVGFREPEEVVGKNDYELPWTEHQTEQFLKDDKEMLRTGTPKINFEEKQTQLNGEEATLLTSKVPLRNNKGEISGVLGTYVDITERKQQEKELIEAKDRAEIANKAKIEFLENMRHDIRTPLVGIIGFAELIKSEVADPKIKEYAGNLVASGQALTDLLNEVLDAIKVSSGDVPILKKKFNLQKKLNEIILLNQSKAQHKKIGLSFDYDPAIPNYLIGDSIRIHRVVLELVANALNFTHKGYVRLSTQLAKDTGDDVVLKIIVEDTGVGIPLEKQQEIYLQFKRLTPSYEGIYKGHGLGLSIAKQFIDDMNGEIYVESQIGVGSKFILILKLKKALLDENLGSEDLISLSTSNQLIQLQETKMTFVTEANTTLYKSHILVVEDSPIAARVLAQMLSIMDCIIDVAKQGKEAVDMAECNSYDLIFMDIGLPDIDGYEVTKRIRLNEFKKNHVPIIALTAHTSEENKKYCIDIGINAILTKPLAQKKAEDILNSFIPYRRERLNLKGSQNIPAEAETIHQTMLAIFNFEELKALFGYNETRAIDVVRFFLEKELPQELQAIQAAYTKKDWLLIQHLVHKLKGGVSYCCAFRLKEACDQLENASRKGEKQHLEDLYIQLLKIAALTEKTIRKALQFGSYS